MTTINDNMTTEELNNLVDTLIQEEANEASAESTSTVQEETNTEETAPEEELIDEVPQALFVKEESSRFSSAVWYKKIQQQEIILAGCGGIGSYVGFLLSRLQVNNLTLFDMDTVEPANSSGQLYSSLDSGRYKVSALADFIIKFSNAYPSYFHEAYRPSSITSDIMICGFDNMEARKTFFTNWKNHVALRTNKEECLFIDGRLAAEEFQIISITGDDAHNIKRYEEEFLFSDEEADETICSYKQTTHCATMIASMMVNIFVNFIANQCGDFILREIPFFTQYDSKNMFLKIER